MEVELTRRNIPFVKFGGLKFLDSAQEKACAKLGTASRYELFAFLTTSPNEIVSPIHQKAMSAILTTPQEVETRLTAPWDEARHL